MYVINFLLLELNTVQFDIFYFIVCNLW